MENLEGWVALGSDLAEVMAPSVELELACRRASHLYLTAALHLVMRTEMGVKGYG